MKPEPRIETMTLGAYLDEINEEIIRNDQDVQRGAGTAFSKNMINRLIYSAVSKKYKIPFMILAEECINDVYQKWVADGGQRGAYLSEFKFGGYRVTNDIEEYIVEYQKNVVDENGKAVRDEDGNIVKETVQYDLRKKTYEDLPKELKNNFNKCNLHLMIYQDCTQDEISTLVEIYNNHKAMNPAQRNLTYIKKYARTIKNLKNHVFFTGSDTYTPTEHINGTLERVIYESIMLLFHYEHWNKNAKKNNTYLNENATQEEFLTLSNYLDRLSEFVDEELETLFTSKNTFIWLELFHRFDQLGLEDGNFEDFLYEFINSLHEVEVNGMSFDYIDGEFRGTKDKKVIEMKLNCLTTLMNQFFKIKTETPETLSGIPVEDEELTEENPSSNEEEVITEFDTNDEFNTYATEIINSEIMEVTGVPTGNNVDRIAAQCMMITTGKTDFSDCAVQDFINNGNYDRDTCDDISMYLEELNEWSLEVKEYPRILKTQNIPALLGFVKHTYDNDTNKEASEWFKKYADRIQLGSDIYNGIELMKRSFDEFLKSTEKKVA